MAFGFVHTVPRKDHEHLQRGFKLSEMREQKSAMIASCVRERSIGSEAQLQTLLDMVQCLFVFASLVLTEPEHGQSRTTRIVHLGKAQESISRRGELIAFIQQRAQVPPALAPRRPQPHGFPVKLHCLLRTIRLARHCRLARDRIELRWRGEQPQQQHKRHCTFTPGSRACFSAFSRRTVARSRSPSALRFSR